MIRHFRPGSLQGGGPPSINEHAIDGSQLAPPENPTSPLPAGDIYIDRADGTDLRQLTSGPAFESFPVCSPDGTRIAYRREQDKTEAAMHRAHSVAVMDGGGGNQLTLAKYESPGCVGETLVWSPDGASLIFPLSAGCDDQLDSTVGVTDLAFRLTVVTVDGSSPTVMLQDVSAASWQPVAAPLPAAPSFAPASPTP